MKERMWPATPPGVPNSGVAIGFESKAPHTTPWLVIEYPEGETPSSLLDALAAIGWATDGMRPLPPLDGRAEVSVGRRGSDLFAGWSDNERKKWLPECRRLLRKFGFEDVPWNKLRLEDLL